MTDHQPRDAVGLGAFGGEEYVAVAWPIVLRERIAERLGASERYRWWVLWTVLAGLFAVNVTFTIFAVSLPRLARELGTSTNGITWVITGPLLAYGVVAPAFGRIGDVRGHRKMYLFGLIGAFLSTLLSAVAWNAPVLVAARVLGALEGAATGSAAMALIMREFDADDRVKAMGFWSLVGAGGPVLGVALGGPLIEAFGWRWIFVAQAPVIAVAIVFSALFLPETEPKPGQRIDWSGAAAATTAVTSLLLALNRGPEWGWSSPGVVAAFAAVPVALVAFVLIERAHPDPLLPLGDLAQRNFAAPIGALAFSNFAYMGGFILAPQLLARVFHYGEAKTGLMVIGRPLSFSIAAPIAGYLAVRVGERVSAVTGCLVVAASMLALTTLDASSSDAVIIGALALSGAGLGVATPSIAATIANAVHDERLGVASAAQQLMGQVGVVAGIQLMQTVQATRERWGDGLVSSFHSAFFVGAGVCLLGALCAAFIGGRPKARREAATR